MVGYSCWLGDKLHRGYGATLCSGFPLDFFQSSDLRWQTLSWCSIWRWEIPCYLVLHPFQPLLANDGFSQVLWTRGCRVQRSQTLRKSVWLALFIVIFYFKHLLLLHWVTSDNIICVCHLSIYLSQFWLQWSTNSPYLGLYLPFCISYRVLIVSRAPPINSKD